MFAKKAKTKEEYSQEAIDRKTLELLYNAREDAKRSLDYAAERLVVLDREIEKMESIVKSED